MIYEYISSGGCARCDAMEDCYEELPPKPHPNCECQIFATAITHDFFYQETGRAYYPSNTRQFVDIDYDLEVWCCGDPTIVRQSTTTITVDRLNPAMFEKWALDLEADFDALAAGCPEPDCLFV
jgi:hypothetical protein